MSRFTPYARTAPGRGLRLMHGLAWPTPAGGFSPAFAPRLQGRPVAAPAAAPALRPAALALFLALVLAWPAAAARAADPAACFSIQVGAFANPDNARRYFTRLLATLPPEAAEQLRLERIGALNVLRLGRTAGRQELDPLLDAVRAAVDNPRVMAVDFRPERFLIPPRRGDLAGSPRPAPPETAPPTPAPAPPASAQAPAAEYAVQAGSYTEPEAAEKAFHELRRALPPAAADQLRLEAIGDLYVLRLGRAASREDLAPLLSAAHAAGEAPRILAADYRPERFLIPPGAPAPAVAPQPARTDAQRESAPAPAAPARPATPAAPAERLPEAVATGYTVQLGSYSSRANALATHARLLAALPPDLAGELRVERVGIHYVLRLGLAPTRGEMLPVLTRAQTYSPMPVLLAADLDPDRLVVPSRSLGREAAAASPAPVGPQAGEPSPDLPAGPAPAAPPILPPAGPAPERTAAAAADSAPTVPEEPLPPLLPFGATAREQDLIQARIAARTGQFPQGKKLYEKILAEHPGDEEVLEQYVDALVDEMEYDLARMLLADWMQRDPGNPRPLRLMGLMFVRAGEHQRAYAPFEDLLERDPGDIGVMADLGFARLGGGDWRRALELFSTVADEQPENEVAAQAVQELLIAHRPRLASDYTTEFRADDAVLATQSNTFSSPLSDRWALDLKYDLIHVDRPSKAAQDRIGHTVQDWMLTTRNLLHENLTAFLGLGAVSGIGERYAQQAGLEWRAHRPGRILVLAERNRPWLDRVDATRYEGFQDHALVAYDALYDDRWGLYLAAERFRYVLLDQEYGRRNVGAGRLTRRLGWKPNLWLGYAYGFGSGELEEDGPRVLSGDVLASPVALDREEESHSGFLTLDERLGRNLRLLLTGGAGQNTISGNAFFFGSGEVRVEVGNRLTVRTGLGHNSDKSSVGGETTTVTVGILWIF